MVLMVLRVQLEKTVTQAQEVPLVWLDWLENKVMLEGMEHPESLELQVLLERLVREDTQALRDLLDPRYSVIS